MSGFANLRIWVENPKNVWKFQEWLNIHNFKWYKKIPICLLCLLKIAIQTWYCWYSATKSFMLDSASVNSISSMPGKENKEMRTDKLKWNPSFITLLRKPMEKSFATEHQWKLFLNAFENLLNGRGISNKSGRHFQMLRRHVTNGCFDIIRDPFHKMRRHSRLIL